jgi:hypothetical protein
MHELKCLSVISMSSKLRAIPNLFRPLVPPITEANVTEARSVGYIIKTQLANQRFENALRWAYIVAFLGARNILQLRLSLIIIPQRRAHYTAIALALHKFTFQKINSVSSVRERTILTEQPPVVCEVSANFCGQGGVV